MELMLGLRTLDPAMAQEWQHAFRGLPGIEIVVEDILASRADAILSPANSFGFMDGGIDLAYRNFFGLQIQARLKEQIVQQHDGELPVGQATVLETGHEALPFLISAPTMRVPSDISSTVNPYLAFRAALLALGRHNAVSRPGAQITSLLSPSLGTGVGGMGCERAARQMAAAYRAVILGERPTGAGATLQQHRDLIR